MSLSSSRNDVLDDQHYSHNVSFENNESDLNESAKIGLDSFFSDPHILLDNAGREIEIRLDGHASAPGSTKYNTELVEHRLNTVNDYIKQKLKSSKLNATTNITEKIENHSDDMAEFAEDVFPGFVDPSFWRKVVVHIKRKGSGGQNVMAHEFGHVFGLGDEYAEVGGRYNRPEGSAASHDQLAKDAGLVDGAKVKTDKDRLMSGGNRITAAHYSTFADALKKLTNKSWKINAATPT